MDQEYYAGAMEQLLQSVRLYSICAPRLRYIAPEAPSAFVAASGVVHRKNGVDVGGGGNLFLGPIKEELLEKGARHKKKASAGREHPEGKNNAWATPVIIMSSVLTFVVRVIG